MLLHAVKANSKVLQLLLTGGLFSQRRSQQLAINEVEFRPVNGAGDDFKKVTCCKAFKPDNCALVHVVMLFCWIVICSSKLNFNTLLPRLNVVMFGAFI